MSATPRPTKRAKHDFSSTFDVRVGQLPGNVKRFTVHTNIFTKRSKFLAAARKPDWIAGDTTKPVDLSDVEPDVFQAYLNCVDVGPETLEETPGAFEREVRGGTIGFSDLYVYNVCKDVTREDLILRFEGFGSIKSIFISKHSSAHSRFESSRIAKIVFFTVEAGLAAIKTFDGFVLHGHRLTVKAPHRGLTVTDLEECNKRRYELADLLYNNLIKLYLLADQLQDTTTSNMVMDKIEQVYATERVHPGNVPISTAYRSTVEGSPLRKLLRNVWLYDTNPNCEKLFQQNEFPSEFLDDVLKLYMGIKNSGANTFKSFTDIEANDWWTDQVERETLFRCRYHQHDDEHPFCPPERKADKPCESCRAVGDA